MCSMATNGDQTNCKKTIQRPVLARTWSENYDLTDIEVPGTPKTPRTSTTPGRIIQEKNTIRNQKIKWKF